MIMFCFLISVVFADRIAVIDEPGERDSLYMVSGDVVPEGANAWYDCRSDTLERFDGAKTENYLARRHSINFAPFKRSRYFRTPPVGWMTWYAVKFEASERMVLKNARDFMDKFAGYNDERPVLWVDWEWFHPHFKCDDEKGFDMFTPNRETYPRGMKALSDDLRAMGFTPALWVSPDNDVATNAVWRAHPEWVLTVPKTNIWCGSTWGDPTAPGFCEEFVPSCFALYRSWGYDVFKWDTLPWLRKTMAENPGVQHDPSVEPLAAVRKMVAAGRKALGDDCFLETCSGEWDDVNRAILDIADSGRVGGDIFTWGTFIKWGVERVLSYQPFNNIVFWPDGDNLVLREEFSTLAQARTRATIYSLAGIPITIGDEISALDDARIDILRCTMPVVELRPASLSRGKLHGDLLRSRVDFHRPFGDWQVRAWSNLSTNNVRHAEFAAPGSAVWDFWRDELLSADGGKFAFDVPPGDTRLLRVTPIAKGAPTLVSVSRHITQGGYELEDYRVADGRVSGSVRCPGERPVTLTFLLPEGMKAVKSSHPYKLDGRILRLTVGKNEKRGGVQWWLEFAF